MATSDAPISVPNVTLAVARQAGPAPDPTGAPSISSVMDNGSTLTITGSNFGSKTQAAPVLHDIGGNAWENGALNDFVASLADGASVPSNPTNANSPYLNVTSKVKINKQAGRFTGGSTYEFEGPRGWIGRPMAYGGSDTPPAAERTYLAFWMERKWHWQYYRIAPVEAVVGAFQPGETVSVSGSTETGRFAGLEEIVGDTDLYNFELSSRLVDTFKGKTLTGDTSGAQIVFPTVAREGSGQGYLPAGTKYVRAQDNDNIQNLVGIFTPADFWVRSNANVTSYTRNYPTFTQSEEPVDTANLYEWEISLDTSTGQGFSRGYLNGKSLGDQTFDASNGFDPQQSIVFIVLGNDAGETFQRTRIHEVYFDPSFCRVYLGNAATWDACTHVELQRPTAWAADAVTVAKHEGALTGSKWVYLRGPDGSINASGSAV